VHDIPVPVSLTPAQVAFCERAISEFSAKSWHISVAGHAGSDRKFIRIASANNPADTFILVIWDSHDDDWERFLTINREISRYLSVLPEIYAHDSDHGLLLIEDCGGFTLKEYCMRHNDRKVIGDVYTRVLLTLLKWQKIDTTQTTHIASRVLDRSVFLWETEYFAHNCVRDYCGLDSMLDSVWEKERNRLADSVAGLSLVCLHRDFQSENIMVQDSAIKFVDYQGARLGPAEYDVASLLFDPYMYFLLEDPLRHSLLGYYLAHGDGHCSEHSFHRAALQRLMQALGAYGKLSLHKNKETYRQHIFPALTLLSDVLQKVPDFPHITNIVHECLGRILRVPRFQ
jgi:aminoglycoside/choline kinase family phosphotransferase